MLSKIVDPECDFCGSESIMIISTALRGIYDLKVAENRAAIACMGCGKTSLKQTRGNLES